jgi:hypothetical protein
MSSQHAAAHQKVCWVLEFGRRRVEIISQSAHLPAWRAKMTSSSRSSARAASMGTLKDAFCTLLSKLLSRSLKEMLHAPPEKEMPLRCSALR